MPTVNRARSSTKRKLSVGEAKQRVIEAIRSGMQVREAMQLVDRAEETYRDWRKNDAAFRAQVDEVREIASAARARGADGKPEVPDFPEFCAEYLNMPMPEHHLRVWDLLNGREPRSLHPAIRYQAGRPNRVLLNFPPYFAKTQVWSTNYALWRMLKDPNVRIAIVSQTQVFAKKILHQIKSYLELPQFAKMHAAFMPEGGWEGTGGWTKTEIYLSGADQGHKDPTVQCLGLGGQIYGSRLDVVILDDLVTGKNVHQFKEIADYVGTEVASRVDEDGVLHVLGTRMGANDLYSELRDLVEWDGESPVWTWFAQPAVLEMPEPDPDSWVTLWPSKWPGRALARAKAELPTQARWDLTYQQLDASMDQVFPTGAVMASIDNSRAAGPMDGLYTVVGVDPAANGYTAMIVMGLDRNTGKRFILDGFNMNRTPPELLIHKLKSFIEQYKCREAIVEVNAFQGFLARSAALRDFCFAHGCLLVEHQTGSRKWDEDLGVSSMSPLWLSCADHDLSTDTWTPRPRDKHLISLPNPRFATFVDQLITQLTTWQPQATRRMQQTPTDLVMACWFANIAIQKVLDQARNVARHMANPFLPRADERSRAVVNLQQMREEALVRGSDVHMDFYTGAVL